MAKTIRVDYLARVEGEGALTIRYKGKRPTSVELRIFEPPRLFEAFLRGRSYGEVVDHVARICGICPVAYQMSACHAIEHAFGITVGEPYRTYRRLLYCGEWIESHALHMFMLHAPDFLGYEDAIRMAKDHRDWVDAGLAIKKAGNALVATLGGREIHPINVRVGGFYKLPRRSDFEPVREQLEAALVQTERALEWMAGFDFPSFERDYELVALRHPHEYPFCEGRLVSNKGLSIEIDQYEQHFVEEQVPHSTALHSTLRERGAYLCGPLARLNLCYDELRPRAKAAADAVGMKPPVLNPFKSLLARGVELVQALDEACSILDAPPRAESPAADVTPREGVGHGCTEAPRGILYHRYAIEPSGLVADARIVPPTSQNQRTIEEDLFELAPSLADMKHAAATWRAEQAVRNYDPCISCSTHFLRLTREHTE